MPCREKTIEGIDVESSPMTLRQMPQGLAFELYSRRYRAILRPEATVANENGR